MDLTGRNREGGRIRDDVGAETTEREGRLREAELARASSVR